MKAHLILLLTLFSFYRSGFPQSCPGGKVVGPAVAEPTLPGIVTATCSTLVVKWTPNAGQSYTVSASRYNPITNTKDTVNGSTPTCTGSNCTSVIPVVAGTKVTWSVQSMTFGSTPPFDPVYSYPVISVLDYPISPCNQPGNTVTFSGRVMLQGAYNAATGMMTNTLNTLGILQTQAVNQPYNILAFTYTGTEKAGAGFFAAHPDITDWVLIELRDANAPLSPTARRAVFVEQDGTLVDTNGVSTVINFPGIASTQYYVSVRHRNHLGIRSAAPVDFSSGTADHDFTSASFKSYQSKAYTSSTQMGSKWAMRAGDANINQNVRYTNPGNDQNQIFNTKLGGSLSLILNNVYAAEDLNMDGVIKWTNPGNEQNFLLNILLKGSLSIVLETQF